MGLDFYLACYDCKVFMDLHKWPLSWEQGKHLVQLQILEPHEA